MFHAFWCLCLKKIFFFENRAVFFAAPFVALTIKKIGCKAVIIVGMVITEIASIATYLTPIVEVLFVTSLMIGNEFFPKSLSLNLVNRDKSKSNMVTRNTPYLVLVIISEEVVK